LRPEEAARKKQLGQYFTGQRVGRLLAALAEAEKATSIIDPMVGSGDLLAACLAVGAKPKQMVGLELDPLALAQARGALTRTKVADLVPGDAFHASLPPGQFDLVITNPPYIRYQSKGSVDGIAVPSADSVRGGLLRAIRGRSSLSGDALAAFLHAARSYPGTADVAVPAWILSAALVRDGGMLAVVAPQAWLSRNYAHAVRQLLDRAFDVEVIVEDGDASWFEDALVRTQLVVARRRSAAAAQEGHSVVMARATRELDRRGALLGTKRSERALATALRAVRSTTSVRVSRGLMARVEHDLSVAAAGQVGRVPSRVAARFGSGPGTLATRTLESYGWRCGQGLRSGANDFFYVSIDEGLARPASRWGIASLPIPSECLIPSVRRQTELGGSLSIEDGTVLPSRVLYLRGWATAEDRRRMPSPDDVQSLPREVGRWIAQVAATPRTSSDPTTKLFPELAAVAPNAKTDKYGRPVAFWYQLPLLAPRHTPMLFMPRVCGGQPRVYRNVAGAVIDANFSTLWPVEPDAIPPEAMFALLNSTWVWANLEEICTVLGGGALKVEATDLRRLALPDLDGKTTTALAKLGRQLRSARGHAIGLQIDEAVALAVSGCDLHSGTVTTVAEGLRELAVQAMEHRSSR
jgi:hypothetical protein